MANCTLQNAECGTNNNLQSALCDRHGVYQMADVYTRSIGCNDESFLRHRFNPKHVQIGEV
jgi:hypothetical protein